MATTTSGEAVALRAELYAARRSAGALQKDLDAVTAERDRLLARLDGATTATNGHEGELQRLKASLDKEVAARKAAEQEAERVGTERHRLQKARDELATTLLAVQQRASEAEEDQQRAEQQALAAAAELEQLQLQHQQPWQPADNSQQPSDLSTAPGGGLELRLEAERNRNAILIAALSSAKAERDAALMEAAGARKQQLGMSAGVPASSSAKVQDGGLPHGPASVSRTEASYDDVSEPEKGLASLQGQVAQLKASRDKLIAQVSIQLAETDRMSVENTALAQALHEAREAAGSWERQFQEALGQQERLKDLLEESALWQTGAGEPGGSSTAPGEFHGGGEDASNVPAEGAEEGAAVSGSSASAKEGHLAALEQRYVQECARTAALDVQVRALCAELSRSAAVTSDLSRSVLPALAGVEARLSQALQRGADAFQAIA